MSFPSLAEEETWPGVFFPGSAVFALIFLLVVKGAVRGQSSGEKDELFEPAFTASLHPRTVEAHSLPAVRAFQAVTLVPTQCDLGDVFADMDLVDAKTFKHKELSDTFGVHASASSVGR